MCLDLWVNSTVISISLGVADSALGGFWFWTELSRRKWVFRGSLSVSQLGMAPLGKLVCSSPTPAILSPRWAEHRPFVNLLFFLFGCWENLGDWVGSGRVLLTDELQYLCTFCLAQNGCSFLGVCGFFFFLKWTSFEEQICCVLLSFLMSLFGCLLEQRDFSSKCLVEY